MTTVTHPKFRSLHALTMMAAYMYSTWHVQDSMHPVTSAGLVGCKWSSSVRHLCGERKVLERTVCLLQRTQTPLGCRLLILHASYLSFHSGISPSYMSVPSFGGLTRLVMCRMRTLACGWSVPVPYPTTHPTSRLFTLIPSIVAPT